MKKNINDLRTILFETMEDLKSGKIDVDRAKQIGNLGQVILNTAIVEVKYISESGGSGTCFIMTDDMLTQKPIARQITMSEHEKIINKYIN